MNCKDLYAHQTAWIRFDMKYSDTSPTLKKNVKRCSKSVKNRNMCGHFNGCVYRMLMISPHLDKKEKNSSK